MLSWKGLWVCSTVCHVIFFKYCVKMLMVDLISYLPILVEVIKYDLDHCISYERDGGLLLYSFISC